MLVHFLVAPVLLSCVTPNASEESTKEPSCQRAEAAEAVVGRAPVQASGRDLSPRVVSFGFKHSQVEDTLLKEGPNVYTTQNTSAKEQPSPQDFVLLIYRCKQPS